MWPLSPLHCSVLALLLLFGPFFASGKQLQLDIDQIEADVLNWEEELEGHDEVDGTTIPGLNDQPLHVVELVPGSEGQSYVVYKQMSVDTTKYTRHSAYLRRFKGVSAVEWNPIANPEDNVADGDFVELFVPSLFQHKRCNGIISTPYRSIHNYFYRQAEEGCTVPTPYQDCCGGANSNREDINYADIGRTVSELDEEEEGYEPEIHARRRREGGQGQDQGRGKGQGHRQKRKTVYKSKVGMDELDVLMDALANIEGPPGYHALGEFYQSVLDISNGSQIVYEARHRVSAAANESDVSDKESAILAAETMMMTNADDSEPDVPKLEDPSSAFTGYLSCNYSKYTTAKVAYDKLKKNIVRFYIHKLRGQCVLHAFDKALGLFGQDLIGVTTGLRTELASDNELLTKSLLSKEEWTDLISAIFFVSFSNAYMDVAEAQFRGVHDNRDAVGGEISWTVRTITVMAVRGVGLVDELLSTHVVKTLQLLASAVKEKLFASLNKHLKLESLCAVQGLPCTRQLAVSNNNQLHLISLLQFIVYGSSGALQRKERSVEVEFNMFYVQTLEHMKGVLDKIRVIREGVEAAAVKKAKEDKANEITFA